MQFDVLIREIVGAGIHLAEASAEGAAPEAGLSFAEMPHSQKAELGHRGRAFAALKPQLQALMAATESR